MSKKPTEHRLTFWTLVRRSLRFHARAHLGVVLGAALGSAVLVGALVVGDSVRETLKERAVNRLGEFYYALHTPERLFDTWLTQDLLSTPGKVGLPLRPGSSNYVVMPSAVLSTALMLPGSASRAEGSARVNAVNVIGVDVNTWPEVSRGGPRLSLNWALGGEAMLNPTLARQLGVKAGDEIVVRVRKPSALALDAALSPRDQTSVALRLKVGSSWPADKLGDFSLSPQAPEVANVFLPLSFLADQVGVADRANIIMTGAVEGISPGMSAWARRRAQVFFWCQRRAQAGSWVAARLASWLQPWRECSVPDEMALPWLNERLSRAWRPEDAGISVRTLPTQPAGPAGENGGRFVEVSSTRLFLEPAVIAAALQPNIQMRTNIDDTGADMPDDVAFSRFVTNGVRILTYLANSIRAGERMTPYSMVTAANGPYVPSDMGEDEILVNEWLAQDLTVKPGDSVSLSYYVADSGSRLVERTNAFRVRAIVPLQGLYADRTLMPEFPGIAQAESTHAWDGGFPLVYPIRQKDEDYWKGYRGTPKAFISLAAGQKLWANRFGALTAIRYEVPSNMAREPYRHAAYANLVANLKASDLGFRFEPVRGQALRAVEQGQDFGQLFLGFSLFLVVAALLLMGLLFQFGLEQRAGEVTTLRALGFREKQIRRLFLTEGVLLALVGGVLGTVGGCAYARAMLWGLATIWSSAVGHAVLEFHATAQTLAVGLCAGMVVGVGTIWLTVRRVGTVSSKSKVQSLKSKVAKVTGWRKSSLINTPLKRGETREGGAVNRFNGLPGNGEAVETAKGAQHAAATSLKRGGNERGRVAWNRWGVTGTVAALVAIALVISALARGDAANAEAFFGAGTLLLLAGLSFAAVWLDGLAGAGTSRPLVLFGIWRRRTRGRDVPAPAPTQERRPLKRHECRAPEMVLSTTGTLALRGCARRRNRSLATIALLACGCFIIVAIGAFRLDANQHPERRTSGTGGFALIGNSTLPILQDLNTASGREAFGLNADDLKGAACVPFRMREGDDASCLSLARAQKPRLLGVNPEVLKGRFTFTQVAHGLEHDWSVLKVPNPKLPAPSLGSHSPQSKIENLNSKMEEIPAVADANTLEWGLGKRIGDTLDYIDDQGHAFKIRLVGTVANSILQGSLIVDETEFMRHFPNESGYRMVLVDAPVGSVAPVSATLSRALQDLGLELTPAPQRLNVLNAVENTYLSTFQVLGGLGLLLGSAGLGVVVLRNVLERRSELAVLLAMGFRRQTLARLVLVEHAALLAVGLGIGIGAALVAVLPALWSSRAALPFVSLALTLTAVCLNGLLWAWLATRYALRGNLIAALRTE